MPLAFLFRRISRLTVDGLEAIRRALPDAVQVADRWHVWHNLCEAALSEVKAHSTCWAPVLDARAGRTWFETRGGLLMSPSEDEDRRRAARARQVALFRYGLIQDLIDNTLTTRERGRLARELAEKEHTDPFGRQVKVSRGTIDRWTATTAAAGSPPWSPSRARRSPGHRRRCWNLRPR